MTAYARNTPSPDYLNMVAMYETLHEQGESLARKTGKETFPGKMLIRHTPGIKQMIDRTGATSILDYGAGKGAGYEQRDIALPNGDVAPTIQEYWGVSDIRCYDPGHEPFKALPEGRYDGVICTDVLEHVTEPDVPWIIDEMFSYARKFVYANIACYPAVKFLSDGQNVHCTIRPPDWWAGVFHAVAMRHTEISYRLITGTVTKRRKKLGFAKNRKKDFQTVERMA